MHARFPNFLQYLILKLFHVYVIVVDGAIHRAAGPNLLKENREHGGCKDGEAVISGGYRLPAKYIISTVGPRGEKPEILHNAYTNCLLKMKENKLRSIVSKEY